MSLYEIITNKKRQTHQQSHGTEKYNEFIATSGNMGLFWCHTTAPIMHMLHVSIDNQAFMFMHVAEQVQRFKQEQSILISTPSESEIVRGGEVGSNETDNRDPARKLGGAADKKKMSRIHVRE